jgi:hypothetical protein
MKMDVVGRVDGEGGEEAAFVLVVATMVFILPKEGEAAAVPLSHFGGPRPRLDGGT